MYAFHGKIEYNIVWSLYSNKSKNGAVNKARNYQILIDLHFLSHIKQGSPSLHLCIIEVSLTRPHVSS